VHEQNWASRERRLRLDRRLVTKRPIETSADQTQWQLSG
jgi:hypothetical protein